MSIVDVAVDVFEVGYCLDDVEEFDQNQAAFSEKRQEDEDEESACAGQLNVPFGLDYAQSVVEKVIGIEGGITGGTVVEEVGVASGAR